MLFKLVSTRGAYTKKKRPSKESEEENESSVVGEVFKLDFRERPARLTPQTSRRRNGQEIISYVKRGERGEDEIHGPQLPLLATITYGQVSISPIRTKLISHQTCCLNEDETIPRYYAYVSERRRRRRFNSSGALAAAHEDVFVMSTRKAICIKFFFVGNADSR
jgi:hypothetical protein